MKSGGMTILSIATFDHDPSAGRIECAKWKHC